MKKLLAILVILMLAVPMFAGTDILNFMWFNNKIAGSMSDVWNPASNPSGVLEEDYVYAEGDETATYHDDAVVRQWNYYGFLEQFMCGMWGTIYEGDNVTLRMDFFNYFSCELGDWSNATLDDTLTLNEQIQFFVHTDIAGIYTLSLGAKDIFQLRPFLNDTATFQWRFHRIHLMLNNSIKVAEIMNIGLNVAFEFVQLDTGVMGWATNNASNDPRGHTDLDIDIIASLSGSYSFGFSWSLSQEIKIGLDLERYKDTYPTDDGTGVGVNDDGGVIGNRVSTNLFRRVPLFQTNLNLSQEVLGLAGVEGVTLTIQLIELLQVNKPYSYGLEQNARIETQGKYGLVVGWSGLSFGLYMTLATQDTYNENRPYNSSASAAGPKANALVPDDYYDMNWRPHGRGQMGVMFTIGYSRGFFGFDFSYHGQGQIRDWDKDGDNFYRAIQIGNAWELGEYTLTIDNGGLFRNFNSYHRWCNQLDVAINFSW